MKQTLLGSNSGRKLFVLIGLALLGGASVGLKTSIVSASECWNPTGCSLLYSIGGACNACKPLGEDCGIIFTDIGTASEPVEVAPPNGFPDCLVYSTAICVTVYQCYPDEEETCDDEEDGDPICHQALGESFGYGWGSYFCSGNC